MNDVRADGGGAANSCPACGGTDVRVALQGQTYPVYRCEGCRSHFCRPPARIASQRVEASDASFSERPRWCRAFGEIRVEVSWHHDRWRITIHDGAQSVLTTHADGHVEEAKSKAERLVGHRATTAWEAVA